MELISRLSRAGSLRISKDTSLQALSEKIDQLYGNQRITKDDFRRLIVSRNAYFSDRLFQMFDSTGCGYLTKQQIIDCIKEIIDKPVADKLTFFFQINDIDGDGFISFRELRHLLQSCMTENGLVFSEEEINNLTYVLFEYADTDHTGTICFNEFKALIARHQGLIENISISIDRWLLAAPSEIKPPPQSYLARKLNYTYIRNNRTSVCFFIIYSLINLVLFDWRVTEYAREGKKECIWIARGAGICLNFNCAFIILLILRRTLTFLRTLGINEYFPVDQHIYYHKLCGYIIAFFATVHTVSHLINFVHLASVNPEKRLTDYLFGLNPDFKWFYGAASITGWICLLSLTIIVVSSLPYVRKSGHFEIFYYCHLFYFVFWIALILHGPVFWIWCAFPLFLFFIERFILIKRMFGSAGHTYIEKGVILPSRVAHLVIKRPPNFNFRPGDWVYLQIPSIAAWEWHPFTISSAPEMEDVIWLHIRGVGEWTKRVCEIIEEQEKQGIPLGGVRCPSNPVFLIEDVATPKDANFISLNRLNNSPQHSHFNSSHTRTSSPYDQSYIRLTDSNVFTSPFSESGGVTSYWSDVKPNLVNDKKLISIETHLLESPIPKTENNPLSDANNNSNLNNNVNNNSELVANYSVLGEANVSFQTVNLTRSRCGSLAKPDQYNNVCKRKGDPKKLLARLSCIYPAQGISRRQSKFLKFPRPQGKRWSEPFNLFQVTESFQPMSNRLMDCEAFGDNSNKKSIGTSNRHPVENGISNVNYNNNDADASCSNTNLNANMLKATIPLPVRLDGPYGSPSSHIFNTQHAVLIATGIGVTPFASILQSIMFRYLEARQTCPRCCYSWTQAIPPSVMTLRKVDFVWINREQRSFEWFVHLLSQLEITQAELMESDRFLDMHIYITSAIDNADIRAIGLHLALDLMHNKEERDLITGLKTRTKPGRPKWDEFFTEIQRKNKGRVSLFYCGPPPLGKILHNYSNQYGFNFYKEIF